jgi:CO/xanthine dehydrogenase Mo-binding subunit
MGQEYRHLGKATPRKDAREIVTGRAQFSDDIKIPQMLYGKVLRSPYPHANIKNIDTRKAEAYPGVRAVLTYKNVPGWKWGSPRHKRVLDSKVRFVGDAVALAAAETAEAAEEALELIEVEYEQLPAVYNAEESIKPDAPQLYSEYPGNVLPRGFPFYGPKTLQEIVMGDVEKGFQEADFVAEGTCAYENIPNPVAPEPPGVIAFWEGPDQLTIWTAAPGPYLMRFSGQSVTKLPNIRVISTHVGASYGSKGSLSVLAHAAALAKVTGRPVKVYYTKEEQFTAFNLRLGSRIRGKVGIKKDGTVTAVSAEWLVDTGATSEIAQGMIAVALGEAQVLLRCSNWNFQPHVVLTNRCYSSSVRGFGGQELKSALLPMLNMVMEKADLDPVDFFKKNFAKAGDGYYWRDGLWWVCRGADYSKAMQKGAEVFGWKDKWKGWGKPTAVEGTKRRGVGVGVHGNADTGEDKSEAYVRLTSDSIAVLYSCIAEHGTGQRSSLCKMVAEVLNLPLDNVTITPPDTLLNPFEFGASGSRGTYAAGSAAIEAAEDAKRKLFELAAPKLGAKVEDLETKDGLIYVRDDVGKKIPWREVIDRMNTCTGQGRFETDFSFPNFMITFVEVEVDEETGKTDLIRVINATDVGQIIDPLTLGGQLYGALGSAGIDTALFEESVLDKSTGHIMNCNMMDYKWRTFLDLPEFQNVILETPVPSHRFKAIGVGEITAAPGPSAVLMAISNAIGKRVTDYPATPGKILRALGKI